MKRRGRVRHAEQADGSRRLRSRRAAGARMNAVDLFCAAVAVCVSGAASGYAIHLPRAERRARERVRPRAARRDASSGRAHSRGDEPGCRFDAGALSTAILGLLLVRVLAGSTRRRRRPLDRADRWRPSSVSSRHSALASVSARLRVAGARRDRTWPRRDWTRALPPCSAPPPPRVPPPVVVAPDGHGPDAFAFRPRVAARRTPQLAPGALCWVCGRPEVDGHHDH